MEPEAKKINLKVVIALVVIAVIVAAIIFLSSGRDSADSARKALEDLGSAPDVSVPSANPLRQVTPAENPLEKTNPFKHEYQNPFE